MQLAQSNYRIAIPADRQLPAGKLLFSGGLMYSYIHIFGRTIGSYGLMMAIGFLLVGFLAFCKARRKSVAFEDILIVSAAAVAVALIGGKLLYIFVTYPVAEIWNRILEGDFTVLGGGGIVFYGGLIGGVFGAMMGIRIAGCKFADVERVIVPYIPLGHAVGRIGCVLAGCCHGFAYDGPFALYYPHSVAGLSPEQGYFPVQLLEALINLCICCFLLWYEKKMKRATDLLFTYLKLYAISRFFLEMLRGDTARGVWYGLSTSQVISILLFIISIVGVLWKRKDKAAIS